MEWISVKDKSPEYNEKVLLNFKSANTNEHYITVGVLSLITRHIGEDSPKDDKWFIYPSRGGEITNRVTHWMPLPKPPTK